jgi:hypothetical protein
MATLKNSLNLSEGVSRGIIVHLDGFVYLVQM